MRFINKYFQLLFWSCFLFRTVCADVSLPAIISDHMMLQADVPCKVWGWAEEDESVVVYFLGKEYHTITRNGCWELLLPHYSAGDRGDMIIHGKNKIIIEDVLVGEVWLGSGQSNMYMRVESTSRGWKSIAKPDNDEIRLFVVKKAHADTPQTDLEGFWVKSNYKDVRNFSAILYFFGYELQRRIQKPVGLILSCIPGSLIHSWSKECHLPNYTEEQVAVRRYKKRLHHYEENMKDFVRDVKAGREAEEPKHPLRQKPGAYYNAMIVPLQKFQIRGCVWYQGESDHRITRRYEGLLSAMIEDWRVDWGLPSLPFLIVQLTGYNGRVGVDANYPYIREAQLKVAKKLENVEICVTIDHGNEMDVHSKEKRSVGRRLANTACATVYNQKINYKFPVMKSVKKTKTSFIVQFENVYDGLRKDGFRLNGFMVGGDDNKFEKAKAKIISKDLVIVYCKDPRKKYLRYGWEGFPECNLYNSEYLPVSPFRSDNIPRYVEKPESL